MCTSIGEIIMKLTTTLIIGHKNPDTDSIVSSIAYANLKKSFGENDVFAASAGELNRETRFVLDYFGVEYPLVIEDVHIRVKDVMDTDFVAIEQGSPFKKVLDTIKKEKVLMVPVIDKGELKGVIGAMEIADSLVSETDIETSRKVNTSVENILHCLGGTLCIGNKDKNFPNGNLIVGAMAVNSIAQRIRVQYGFDNIVLVGDRTDAQLSIIKAGVKCLIITGGFIPEQRVIEKAKELDVVVIVSPYDTITSVRLVKLSTTVDTLMDSQIIPLTPEMLLKEAIEMVTLSPTRCLPVINEDNQLIGTVTALDLSQGRGVKLILVDHNEESQAINGICEAEVIEVIDHHKIGSISTLEPICFTCEPVGSTSTLIAERYENSLISPSTQIAGILLSGIISDTLLFHSSTTTVRDRNIAKKLALLASIEDIEKFGREMFHHGIDEEKSAKEIILSDYKEYEFGGSTSGNSKKVGIGQIQLLDGQSIINRKEEFEEALNNLINSHKLELAMFIITDILLGGSTVLFAGNEQIMKTAFDYPASTSNKQFFLIHAFSRKKDFLPKIGRAFR